MSLDPRTPVIAGVGQVNQRDEAPGTGGCGSGARKGAGGSAHAS